MIAIAPLEARLEVSANWRVANSYIQHATRLRRYRNNVDTEMRDVLRKRLHIPVLREAERRLGILQRKYGDQTRYRYRTDKGYRALLAYTKTKVIKSIDQIFGKLSAELYAFANEEANFAINVMGREIPIKLKVPSPADFQRLVAKEAFEGATLKQHLQGSKAAMFNEYSRALNTGLANGETPARTMKRLRGTKAAGFKNGVVARTQNRLSTLTRTSVQHASGRAMNITHQKNERVVKREIWTAVLDSGVCFACASEDGQTYKKLEGPVPPLHPHCRCVRLPVLKSAREMGFKPGELDPAQRRALDGSIPRTRDFDKWFSGQSRAYKKDYLGPGRYELWKRGRVKNVKQFIDSDYRTLSLDELYAKF